MSDMSKKKEKKPNGPGRPKTLDDSLDKRWQIRCNSTDQLNWEALARLNNLPDASTLVRKVMNDAIKSLTPTQRRQLDEISAKLEAA